jgi:hypothetical protein
MENRLPDFIIGGAPRAGTTWLYHLLDRHPGVYMAKPVRPEPKFFLTDDLYARGIEYYARTWFAGVDPRQIAGEKSTDYLEHACVAERIHQHLPNVKLIFILREPASRAFSNYLWSRMNGLEHEDFRAALELEEAREEEFRRTPGGVRFHAYFSRGLYAGMLQPFFDRFAKQQILCLRYEDITEKPDSLAERLHRWLGVIPRPDDARALGVVNRSEKNGLTIPADVREELLARYAEPNRKLARLLGPEFEIWKES